MVREPTDVDRERRALVILDGLLALEPAERVRNLDESCGGDVALRERVMQLLGREEEGELGRPLGLPRVPELEDTPAPELGTSIGGFDLVREIARGGMGRVYEAEQENPKRRVALKVLRFGLESEGDLRRFQREAEVLGRLHHPYVAQVYDAGVHRESTSLGEREVPWFALEYVEGARTLSEWVAEERPAPTRIAELFANACDAVHHGHQKGVVHRDLKPSNVLVDMAGNPKVIDFGVARLLDTEAEGSRATLTGQLVGTVPYMSPEQARGDSADVDVRSDVYSLGVLLYRLLTGKAPYPVDDQPIAEAARVIAEVPPTPLRRVDPALPRDLETIVMKALEKAPDRRYVSAAAMADDLRNLLRNEPIAAHPPSRSYRMRLFVRRNRVLVGATVLLVTTLGVASIVSWDFALAADDALERAERVQGSLIEYGQTVTLDFMEELARRGVSPETRVEILRATIEQLDALEASAEEDPDVLLALSESYSQLGELSSSPNIEANLGDAASAEASYLRAHALALRVLEARPEDRQARFALFVAKRGLAEVFEGRGFKQEATQLHREVAQGLEQLVAEDPEDAVAVTRLGWAVYAVACTRHDDLAGIEQDLRRAIALFEEAAEMDPELAGPVGGIGAARGTLSIMLHMGGDSEAALQEARAALDILEASLAEDPSNLRALLAACGARMNVSQALSQTGHHAQAVELARSALDDLDAMRRGAPNDRSLREMCLYAQEAMGVGHYGLARKLQKDGQAWRPEAGAALEAFAEAERELVELPGDAPHWFDTIEERLRQRREKAKALLAEDTTTATQ